MKRNLRTGSVRRFYGSVVTGGKENLRALMEGNGREPANHPGKRGGTSLKRRGVRSGYPAKLETPNSKT